jgi:hypothetical protein
MNKSTPIAQLPALNQQGAFINDQQRQMITQAQAAIQQSTMPQNTQLSSDIINDDDPAIQEVLSQFNGGGNLPQKGEQLPNINVVQQNHLQQQQMMAQLQAQQNYMENMAQLGQLNQSPPQIIPASSTISTEVLKNYIIDVGDDLTLSAIVFGLFIVVHFIPIENMITKYISLDRIPYHGIIIKAIFAALLFFFIKKLIV